MRVADFVIFPTSIMVLFEIHQRFKGHFLNKLRVSFKVNFKIYDVTNNYTYYKQLQIHILANVSRTKDNQTMKFGQVIEYHKRNIFFQKSCKIIYFKKRLYMKQRQTIHGLVSIYFDSPSFSYGQF